MALRGHTPHTHTHALEGERRGIWKVQALVRCRPHFAPLAPHTILSSSEFEVMLPCVICVYLRILGVRRTEYDFLQQRIRLQQTPPRSQN